MNPDHVHHLYRLATYALLQWDLQLPLDRIILDAKPQRAYKAWVRARDTGWSRREQEAFRRERAQEEAAGRHECGLCTITDPTPRYRVSISYPEERTVPTLWDAYVFGYLAHELAHVWWFEESESGRTQRDNQCERLRREDTLEECLEELPTPGGRIKSYEAFQEYLAQSSLSLEWKQLHLLYAALKGDSDALHEAATLARHRYGTAMAGHKLALHEDMPTPLLLQEGWAEYVRCHALEWFYQQQDIHDLEESDVPYAHPLQQMELWKRSTLPSRLGVLTQHEPIENGPYTEGLTAFNQFRTVPEARDFLLTATGDGDL